ncbi:hypothetical protein GCM10008023_39300 [Sphingomonas glacialis]|uniref:Lipoprotein n=1 Tax=Sphingomonas glacialis TaxID=658225 RepID=A0ABQ3LUM1_9SPHN|nr:hypothetical protein GCM10008023_39300 [Sphingomonas glacialis]
MKRLTLVALGALALSGCAGTHIKPPAVCDGKHRRPANLYGSILPSLPVPLPASQQGAGQSMVAPPTGAVSPAPAPSPDLAPGAGSTGSAPSGPGAMNVPRSAPRKSLRDAAPTYFSC